MNDEFKLSDYWLGESEWSKKILPEIIEDICISPLANRILITGPIGVGKSRLARIIAAYIRYLRVAEKEKIFLLQAYRVGNEENPFTGIPEDSIPHFASINIATLPAETGIAELFGIAPNYYTNVEGKPGIFEKVMYKEKENPFYNNYYKSKGTRKGAADDDGDKDKDVVTGGIVFLDEIADANPLHQTALLKVVAEGYFSRQGCTIKVEHFDGIIIGATWQKLEGMDPKSKAKFRPDLLSRFESAVINIPPLSERPEDIVPTAKMICSEINRKLPFIQKQKLEKDRSLGESDFLRCMGSYFIAIEEEEKGYVKFNDIIKPIRSYTWDRGNARELRIGIERWLTSRGKKPMERIIEELKRGA